MAFIEHRLHTPKPHGEGLMPIRADLRHHYTGAAWRETRARILRRAGDRCEQCLVPNGAAIARTEMFPGWWFTVAGEAHDQHGKRIGHFRACEFELPDKLTTIRLGIAHLNHDPADNRDENLRALCARCHFIYDQGKHHNTRATRKDAARPLLAGADEAR